METEADEIRRLVGLDIEQIEAYNPSTSVRKVGGSWVLTCVRGNEWPLSFGARKAAVAQGERHQNLLREMYDDPASFHEVEGLRAAEHLTKLRRYMDEGMSAMAAAACVDADEAENEVT